jgi:hypothetical protein
MMLRMAFKMEASHRIAGGTLLCGVEPSTLLCKAFVSSDACPIALCGGDQRAETGANYDAGRFHSICASPRGTFAFDIYRVLRMVMWSAKRKVGAGTSCGT